MANFTVIIDHRNTHVHSSAVQEADIPVRGRACSFCDAWRWPQGRVGCREGCGADSPRTGSSYVMVFALVAAAGANQDDARLFRVTMADGVFVLASVRML